MEGVDGVFHAAGWYKIGRNDVAEATATNVVGTRAVCELVRDLAVPRLVHTSTLAVNSDTHGRIVDETYRFSGTHLSVYDRTKAEAHDVASGFARDGVPVVIVQPGLVYGPGDTSSIGTMFVRFLNRRLPVIPSVTAFCWGYVDDIARGHLLAMERGLHGRNYYLAGPIHTLVEALDIAQRITAIAGPRLRVNPLTLRAGALLARALERVVSLPPEFTAEGLRVLAGTTYLGQNARAVRELGWTTRPLLDGLMETLRFARHQMGKPAPF
jgi:nucleoside-diphosphate-sugar epimerase